MSSHQAGLIASLAMTLCFGGCASIVSGHNQSLSVVSKHQDADHSGARCTLMNNKGTWFATTPGTVTVRRSFDPLTVTCTAEGIEPGTTKVKSTTKAMAFGNILFGGFIGAGVDVSTGAAFDYPEILTVHMGRYTDLETPAATADAAPVPTTATTATAATAAPAATATATRVASNPMTRRSTRPGPDASADPPAK